MAQIRRLACASLRFRGFDMVTVSAALLISELVTNAHQQDLGPAGLPNPLAGHTRGGGAQ
ncbi:hypothetical protein FBY35_3688 [Streptomyces sp. SLBN-118]|nr:hypothetical protein FBY35_3688 [Streptomyces sp. SLBN-118]